MRLKVGKWDRERYESGPFTLDSRHLRIERDTSLRLTTHPWDRIVYEIIEKKKKKEKQYENIMVHISALPHTFIHATTRIYSLTQSSFIIIRSNPFYAKRKTDSRGRAQDRAQRRVNLSRQKNRRLCAEASRTRENGLLPREKSIGVSARLF